MSHLRDKLSRPLTTPAFDVRLARTLCWLGSAAILILGFVKLTRLPLSETELFFGVLLVLAVGLLGVLIGLVLPMAVRGERDHCSRD